MVIVAAGLTPAWQQILQFGHLVTGQVNRARSSLWCGSGKVLNVGASLHLLGSPSLTLSPIGGATGEQIRADFARRGIPARWINSLAPTRVCTTILDESTGTTTELVENSSPLTDDELKRYIAAFTEVASDAECVVLSGSLPQQTPVGFYRTLMKQTSARAILDVRGQELLDCLPLRPFLVKPNREELATTVGRLLETEQAVIGAMSEVRERGAEWVVVSNGPDPLLVMGPEGLTRLMPPQVCVVNPIGCGDALTAAIAAKIHTGAEPLDAIRFGVEYSGRKAASLFPVLLEST